MQIYYDPRAQYRSVSKSDEVRGAGGGGKRRAEEVPAEAATTIFPTETFNTMACPLDLFIARVEEVTVACCDTTGASDGPPDRVTA